MLAYVVKCVQIDSLQPSTCAAIGLRIMEQVMFAQELMGAQVSESIGEQSAALFQKDVESLGVPTK